jgi:predicted phosphoribosyltransferase
MPISTETGERFRDRREAGRRLAARLAHYRRRPGTVVVGLPRGGVVPAAEVAQALELPLDVIISRKLRAPMQPELAIGAVAEGGAPYLNERTIEMCEVGSTYLAREVDVQRGEIARRRELLRDGKPLALARGGTAILVDDGIATGSTVFAAVRALRERGVRIVLAVPVAPPETVESLRPLVDELVVLLAPEEFYAVGQFYDSFTQVSDEEVSHLLAAARRPPEGADREAAVAKRAPC